MEWGGGGERAGGVGGAEQLLEDVAPADEGRREWIANVQKKFGADPHYHVRIGLFHTPIPPCGVCGVCVPVPQGGMGSVSLWGMWGLCVLASWE